MSTELFKLANKVALVTGATSGMGKAIAQALGAHGAKMAIELEDGIKKYIGPGGIIVQRGTVHLWRNLSKTQHCRIVFILIEAKPFEVDGKPLNDVMELTAFK